MSNVYEHNHEVILEHMVKTGHLNDDTIKNFLPHVQVWYQKYKLDNQTKL